MTNAELTYRYPAWIESWKKLFRYGVAFVGLLMLTFLIRCLVLPTTGFYSLGGMILGLLILAFMYVSVYLYLPNIGYDRNGLYVEFVTRPLFIPWSKIVAIHRWEWHGMIYYREMWLVTVEGLTPCHILISVVHALSFLPGFAISSRLTEHQRLIAEIRKHAAKR